MMLFLIAAVSFVLSLSSVQLCVLPKLKDFKALQRQSCMCKSYFGLCLLSAFDHNDRISFLEMLMKLLKLIHVSFYFSMARSDIVGHSQHNSIRVLISALQDNSTVLSPSKGSLHLTWTLIQKWWKRKRPKSQSLVHWKHWSLPDLCWYCENTVWIFRLIIWKLNQAFINKTRNTHEDMEM